MISSFRILVLIFNLDVFESLHVLSSLYACDSACVENFPISCTIHFFKRLVISRSLGKYISYKGGRAKVKDTWIFF